MVEARSMFTAAFPVARRSAWHKESDIIIKTLGAQLGTTQVGGVLWLPPADGEFQTPFSCGARL